MRRILDLSHYNTVTDWNAVKNSVDGVILRVGYRGYGSGKIVPDKKFAEFAEACKRLGIPFGAYFMSQAINVEEGTEEAVYSVYKAQEYGATLPVIIDSEDGDGTARVVRADGLSKAVRTKVVKAFCDTVNSLGCVGGVYASESWFTSRLNYDELTQYYLWVAKYGKNTGVKTSTVKLSKCDMHQYTSRAQVNGLKGGVDMSEMYTLVGVTGNVVKPAVKVESEVTYDMQAIRKGSKGRAVRIWQIIVGVTADGDFGAKTDRATREFQKAKGLDVDGIVGPKSWKAGLESV